MLSRDSCSCTIGTETVGCDLFSRCVLTVKDGSQLIGLDIPYSVFVKFRDCPFIIESGNVQGTVAVATT